VTAEPLTPVVDHVRLRGRWRTVAARSYGTNVYRVEGRHTFYVKTAPPRSAEDRRFHPATEADRLEWLGGQGFPVPEVVEVGGDERLTWLITTALPGVPATAEWTAEQQRSVLGTVAGLARALHALPLADCPFDQSLRVSLPWARQAVAHGLVDLDDLDAAHMNWSAERLLSKLEATPAPVEDLAVCHGDLCLDNVLVDPDTLALTGVLDAGRLGRADRWRDLAIVLRNFDGEYPPWHRAEHLEGFLRLYGVAVDDERLRYYQLLDEFF